MKRKFKIITHVNDGKKSFSVREKTLFWWIPLKDATGITPMFETVKAAIEFIKSISTPYITFE